MSLSFAVTGDLAAQISWQQSQNLFQGSTPDPAADPPEATFVSTLGDLAVAYNGTNPTEANSEDATVGGVTFVSTQSGANFGGSRTPH